MLMVVNDIYQCLYISIFLYFGIETLKILNNMKVATKSLYRPDGKAVLREFVDYFYDLMAALTELSLARENHVVDLRYARKYKDGLLKS